MIRNRVRIIGGEWRSRLIAFPSRPDLRPTPDRVRETLFNWLGQDLTGKACVDLFAGSGALGFEAASRGASPVVMVERDPAVLRTLAAARSALGASAVEIVRADALDFLARDARLYHIAFLDPPFAAQCWPRLAPLVPPRLSAEGMVYHESATPVEAWPGWEVIKRGKAGNVHYQLLGRTRA